MEGGGVDVRTSEMPTTVFVGRASAARKREMGMALEDVVLQEEPLECITVEVPIIRDHLHHSCEVGEKVALVSVGQDCGDPSVVELDFFVVYLDKVYSRIGSN